MQLSRDYTCFKVLSSEIRKINCYLNKPSKHTDARSGQLSKLESGSSVLPACVDVDKKEQVCPYKPHESIKVSQLQAFLDCDHRWSQYGVTTQGCDSGEAPGAFPNPQNGMRVQAHALPAEKLHSEIQSHQSRLNERGYNLLFLHI